MPNLLEKIFIGLTVAVLSGLILTVMTQSGNKPIVQLVDGANYLCQDSFNFNGMDKEGYFSVRVRNSGKDGIMYLNFESNDVLSKINKGQNFENITSGWGPSTPNDQMNFVFTLKKASNDFMQKNITLSYTYGCYNDIIPNIYRAKCIEYKVCCVYAKDEVYRYGESYKRVSESYC